MDYEHWIGGVRAALGAAPRSFSPETMRYLTPPEPHWLRSRPSDRLWGQYYHHELLLTYGEVSWGIVQKANPRLLEPAGTGSSPGTFVFSPDRYYDSAPAVLTDLAARLLASERGDNGDPDLDRYRDVLARQLDRSGKLPIAPKLVEGREVYAVDLVVHREHLPVPYLAGTILPLFHHASSRHAWIVPADYWPQNLVAAWLAPASGPGG
jgi:hypothetical protein